MVFFLFHPLQITKAGAVKIIFLSWKKISNPPNHNVEQNWSIFFKLVEKENESL